MQQGFVFFATGMASIGSWKIAVDLPLYNAAWSRRLTRQRSFTTTTTLNVLRQVVQADCMRLCHIPGLVVKEGVIFFVAMLDDFVIQKWSPWHPIPKAQSCDRRTLGFSVHVPAQAALGWPINRKTQHYALGFFPVVGDAGFEPATPCL